MLENRATHSVVLVSPPITLEDRYGKDMKNFGAVTEPLGLAYLAACLEEENIPVKMIDAPAENLNTAGVVQKIDDAVSLVGISVLTPSFGVVRHLCNAIKSKFPAKKIILGGPHCTALPERTLSEIQTADFVCFGEGEFTLKALAMHRETDPLDAIAGLCYRDQHGKIVRNAPRAYVGDIDRIPMPARHLLPMKRYHLTASRVEGDSYCPTVIVARGCPFKCTYCSHSFGRKIRYHSVDRIINEIQFLMDEYQITRVNLEADTLTASKSFVSRLCDRLVRSGISKTVKWTCESRVDTVTEKMLRQMKNAGCWQISYGIETGCQRLLNSINKSISLKQVEETVRLTHETGIKVRGFFMLGLPTETKSESLETIDFAIKLNPQWAQFTITIPYPGTPMFDALDQQGKIRHYNWPEYNTWSGWKKSTQLPYVGDGRELEELLALQKTALRKFYFRPAVFFRFLLSIRSFSEFRKYAMGFFVLVKSRLS